MRPSFISLELSCVNSKLSYVSVLVADDAYFSFIYYLSNMLNQVVVILFGQAYIEKLLCTSLSCYTHPNLYFRDQVVLYFCDQGVFKKNKKFQQTSIYFCLL